MDALEFEILRFITEATSKVTFNSLKHHLLGIQKTRLRDVKRALANLVVSGEVGYTFHYGRSFIEIAYDRPRQVSDRVILKPTNRSFFASLDQIVINLEKGAAFGGGEHPTTRLCIQLIDEILRREPWQRKINTLRAVDIGTGSGVLAIVAAKMGVGFVSGIDTDPCSIHEARVNVNANALARWIEITDRPLSELSGSYDLVLANLRTPTLIAMCKLLDEKTKAESVLIFSGIKDEEADGLCGCYQKIGFGMIQNRSENGWTSICLGRGVVLSEGVWREA